MIHASGKKLLGGAAMIGEGPANGTPLHSQNCPSEFLYEPSQRIAHVLLHIEHHTHTCHASTTVDTPGTGLYVNVNTAIVVLAF
jgi:hypothetical protein